MFKRKKQPESNVDFGAPLSPEADKFLAEATAEYNTKQEALHRDWRFAASEQYGYDQESGILKLDYPDGAEFQADGQILGSYSESEGTWEWAWNNPDVEGSMARDSKVAKQVGERLGISYLLAGIVPVPSDEFVLYLSAIGVKATDSIGVFRANAGPIDVLITLKNPRWTKRAG